MKRIFVLIGLFFCFYPIYFSNTSFAASQTLQLGSSGTEVVQLQANLRKLGFFHYPQDTGYFGPVTETALKEFQKSKNIPVTGFFDSSALSSMMESPPSLQGLQIGSSGDNVKVLQHALRQLGLFFYPQDTGYFGPLTEQSLKSFQKKNNLPETGILDTQTSSILYAKQSTPPPAATVEKLALVTPSALNLRSGPSTQTSILSVLLKGQRVTIASCSNGWCSIRAEDKTGYVYGSYLNSNILSKTIFIDAGHGGNDSGSVGIHNTLEKDITLSYTLAVQNELEKAGYHVFLSRNHDTECDSSARSVADELQCRDNLAKADKADVLLSIHTNFYTSSLAKGTETYYSGPKDIKLANMIHSHVQPGLSTVNRGVRQADFYILNHTPIPATLVELGFISNTADYNMIENPQTRLTFAQNIVKGLDDYFN